MNNIERPLDDNSTVSIHDNEKLKQVERKEAKKEKKSGITIRELTIIGLLAGITIALGLSGYGIIPLGPLNVTTLHVPTLIGAIVEGPKVGAFVGFIFGCYQKWGPLLALSLVAIVCGKILQLLIFYPHYLLIQSFPYYRVYFSQY